MSRSSSPFRFRPQVWDLESRFTPAVLSDNLTATTSNVEPATGSTWVTSSFGTGSSAHTLNSVTLLMSNPTAGAAEVDIYTDAGNQPGSLVAALTSPGSFSTSSVAAATFTSASGVSLAANSTYWVVLKATSGEFDWAYTLSGSGTGDGFQGTTGKTTNAGGSWLTYDIYPQQMTVTADTTAGPGVLAFAAAAYATNEGAGTATITVTRTGGSTGAVTLPVTVSGGTATSGSDYTGLPTTVSFAAGATTASFAVAIVNDTLVEGSETAVFALGTPTGGATLGTPATTTLTIADNDGAAAVTPKLTAVAAGSGSPQVIVYNADGTRAYTLTPFGGSFTGGVRVAAADVTGDGTDDIIVGAGPGGTAMVSVYNGATRALVVTLTAFESSFTAGVFVAAGDVNRDGYADVIVTPDQGGGPVVAVYSGSTLAAGGTAEMQRFFGIEDAAFRGGARAAAGDLNSDGYDDIVVSAGFLGGPRISTYSGSALATNTRSHLVGDFFAFESSLRNGAFVTVGDFNKDGYADLAFGGGPSGGPRVLVLSGATVMKSGSAAAAASPIANFFAGDSALRGGVRLAAGDYNSDGVADLLAGSGDGEESAVRVYYAGRITGGNTTTPDTLFDPFGTALANGVYVG